MVSQHSHYFYCKVYYYSSLCFLAPISSYKSWDIETIQISKCSACLAHDGVYFSYFYLLYFWKYSAFSAKFSPFILMEYGDFFKFHSAITSAYVQLLKPFNFFNFLTFKLFAEIQFFFNLTLNQMGNASNPLQNSSTFNLILFLIRWATPFKL